MNSYKLATDLGPIVITPTRYGHISIENRSTDGMYYRGTGYSFSIHLFYIDGKWTHQPPAPHSACFFIDRIAQTGNRYAPVTENACIKIAEEVTKAVTEWAKNNQKILHQAELDKMQREFDNFRAQVDELENKLNLTKSLMQSLSTSMINYFTTHLED